MKLTKTAYIAATKESYKNLREELLDLHEQISSKTSMDSSVSEKLEAAISSIDKLEIDYIEKERLLNDVLLEFKHAQGAYPTLDDRFVSLGGAEVIKELDSITTKREYEYDARGNLIKETIRGDVNTDIIYSYDVSGNIYRMDKYNLQGELIAYKTFDYDKDGNIIRTDGLNTEEVVMASSSLFNREFSQRLRNIEDIDIITVANGIKEYNAKSMWEIMSDLSSRTQNLERNLPDAPTSLIGLTSLMERLSILERKIDDEFRFYEMQTTKGIQIYSVPVEVPYNCQVHLEELKLNSGTDYILSDGKIKFFIEIIDEFRVKFKY